MGDVRSVVKCSTFSTNQMPPNLTLDLKNKNITGKVFFHLHKSYDPNIHQSEIIDKKRASFMTRFQRACRFSTKMKKGQVWTSVVMKLLECMA